MATYKTDGVWVHLYLHGAEKCLTRTLSERFIANLPDTDEKLETHITTYWRIR